MSTSRLSLRPSGRPRTRRVRGDAALPVTPWDSAAPRARGPRARHLGGSRGHLTLRPSSSLLLCPLRPLSTHTRHAFAWRSGWLVFASPTADGTPSAREQNARAQFQPYRDVPQALTCRPQPVCSSAEREERVGGYPRSLRPQWPAVPRPPPRIASSATEASNIPVRLALVHLVQFRAFETSPRVCATQGGRVNIKLV